MQNSCLVLTEILTPGLHLKVLSRRPVREGYEFFADIVMPEKNPSAAAVYEVFLPVHFTSLER